jgi:hypothetical protein
MKKIVFISFALFAFYSCEKSANKTVAKVDIKILHRTCVQTIAKVITPNATIGVNWNKNGVQYTNCFNVGIGNPITIDSVNQVLSVEILATATNPQVICALADIAGTGVTHDVKK